MFAAICRLQGLPHKPIRLTISWLIGTGLRQFANEPEFTRNSGHARAMRYS